MPYFKGAYHETTTTVVLLDSAGVHRHSGVPAQGRHGPKSSSGSAIGLPGGTAGGCARIHVSRSRVSSVRRCCGDRVWAGNRRACCGAPRRVVELGSRTNGQIGRRGSGPRRDLFYETGFAALPLGRGLNLGGLGEVVPDCP